MKYLIIDTETVGMYNNLDTDVVSKLNKNIKDINLLIEFSSILYDENLAPININNILCKADIDPTPESMERNNITPEMLKNKEIFNNTEEFNKFKKLVENEEITLIGHNINFDLEILSVFNINFEKCKIIDTLNLLKKFDTTNSPKRLTYLFYKEKIYQNIDTIINKTLRKTKTKKSNLDLFPHRSLFDCFVTIELLKIIMEKNNKTLQELSDISNEKILYKTMPFGKYKNTSISELKDDYIIYFLKNNNIDDKNLQYTLETEISKRGGFENILSNYYIQKLETMLNDKELTNQELINAIKKIIKKKEKEQLIFSYGKHQGKHIEDVATEDKSYLEFMYNNSKLNKYMVKWYIENILI